MSRSDYPERRSAAIRQLIEQRKREDAQRREAAALRLVHSVAQSDEEAAIARLLDKVGKF